MRRRSHYGQFVDQSLDEVQPGKSLSMTGIVKEQDFTLGRVRVTFPDLDDLESYWLQVIHRRSKDDQHVDMPDIGEHVACVMDANHEDGFVVGAAYSERDTMPDGMTADLHYRRYKDDTVIVYDRAAHKLTATFPDGATLEYDAAASKALVDTPGSVEVNAGTTIEATAGESIKGTVGGTTLEATPAALDITTVTATINATALNVNALLTVV